MNILIKAQATTADAKQKDDIMTKMMLQKLLMIFAMSTSVIAVSCGKANDEGSSPKSGYPTDYSINSQCQTNGPVTVCRALQVGPRLAVLDITYAGGILDPMKVSAFVKANYRDGARQGIFQRLNVGPFDIARIRVTGGCVVGQLGGCAQSGTAEMRNLLLWAQQWDGTLNALDLEIALVDAAGNWDSLFGTNYKFHFDQQR